MALLASHSCTVESVNGQSGIFNKTRKPFMIHASRLMNKVPKVQVSDTTKFNRNLSAGYIKIFSSTKNLL